MKIITINTTDSNTYHLTLEENNHRNIILEKDYDKEEYKNFKEFIETVRKEYGVKLTKDYYDWAGVIMIETE